MVTYTLFSSINDVPDSWDGLQDDDLFLKTRFLRATELGMPNTIKPYYIAVFNEEALCGIAILQHVDFNLDVSLDEANSSLKKQIFKAVNFVSKGQIIVLGNLLQTGQHSYFVSSNFSLDLFFETVYNAIDELSRRIKAETNKRVKCILLKDYEITDRIHSQDNFLKQNHFFKVNVQPSMVMNIPPQWNSFDDYIKDLNKKYRRRFTTATKKGQALSVRLLNQFEIERLEPEIFKLYNEVASNATINLFKLPEHHFITLKYFLQEDFYIYGYFLNEKLIGFFSLIKHNDTLDTYFLGYNSTLNYTYQIYLNMLYRMIKHGVEQDYKHIIFARTAMEIKSSVGAKPLEMVMYMKHTNRLLNRILKWCVKLMTPKKEWQERHPFIN